VPAAAVAAVVALIPGSVVALFGQLAPFSWFIGALLGAGVYLLITARQRIPAPATPAVPRRA
jgi:cytosine/uracil/thiamine/allantoin permease